MTERCEPPLHRFPMKERRCYCESLDVPAGRWADNAILPKGEKLTSGMVPRPGKAIEEGFTLNKSQQVWAKRNREDGTFA